MSRRPIAWLVALACFIGPARLSAYASGPDAGVSAPTSPLDDYKPYVIWKNAVDRFSVRPQIEEGTADWTDPTASSLPERLTFVDFAKLLGQQGGLIDDPASGSMKKGIAFRRGMWYLTPTSKLTLGFRYDAAAARSFEERPEEALGPLPASLSSRLAGLTRFNMLYRINERVSLGFEYFQQEPPGMTGLETDPNMKAETVRSDLQIRY